MVRNHIYRTTSLVRKLDQPLEPTATTMASSSETPYQLDKDQTLKASHALLNHMKSKTKSKEASSTTKSLLSDLGDSSEDGNHRPTEPIWLVITTKTHIVDKKRLRPGKILLPYSLNTHSTTTICLFTADPQRAFKDVIAHTYFPAELSSRITRVIGVAKIKARYKSYESRRQLLAEHEVFLADDRIAQLLPKILGKIFYNHTSKRPIPVNFQPPRFRNKGYMSSGTYSITKSQPPGSSPAASVATPDLLAHEIERTLSCAQVYLSPSATSSVRVGLSSFTPEQLTENIKTVVDGIVERFITKKWRNLRAIHIKGPNTMALPVWLADQLWIDQEDVLLEEEVEQRAMNVKPRASKKHIKKKGNFEDESKAMTEEAGKKIRKVVDGEFSKEMNERREKLREQKEELRMAIAKDKTPKSEGGDQAGHGVKKRKAEDEENAVTAGQKRRGRGKRQLPGGGDAADSGVRERKGGADDSPESKPKSGRSENGHKAETEGTKKRKDGTDTNKELKRAKTVSLAS